ncbi:solute carrier family 22 member 18 isoform X2 [Aphelocoma coerulescens]|uniref:solute carrier family 22 member 18 isoform X2 n=1 Tax=Aphelocoma coerulescens TaxID=39617 RepID=UPI0036053AC1
MNAKTSSEGEEEASGTRNETLGKSGYLGEAKRGQVIRVAYVIAALDLTFLFMQFGVMPYLAKSLGLDSVGFGYLQTIFGVLQLVGGYIFGRFADQFGARAALILSCASGSVFFLLMSLSTSIPLLFLSRLPGVFMHGMPGAQKVITDMTTPSQRAGALGKLGLCFGMGIIAGSALGGVLSTKLGIYFPTYVGLVGSLINTLIAMVWIPSQTKPKADHHVTENRTPGSLFSIREILRLMKFPGVMEVFIVKVFAGLPIGLFMIMFSIISMDFFGLEAVESGYLMSYFGVLQMLFTSKLLVKENLFCCWALSSFQLVLMEESLETVPCLLSAEDQLSICITLLTSTGCPGFGCWETRSSLHRDDPAQTQRPRLCRRGPRHGPDEDRVALLHHCGAAGVCLQHAGHHHRQHPHQGCALL